MYYSTLKKVVYFREICQFYTIFMASLLATEAKIHPRKLRSFLVLCNLSV